MNRTSTRRPTIKDVARIAGVSIGSVSRVLNSNDKVTADVRGRVLAAVAELDFSPDPAAQTMRNRTTRTIGCIIRDINIPVLATFVRAAHDVLYEAGYALMLSNSEGNPARERQLVSVLVARKADALIIAHHSENDAGLEQMLQASGVPIVLFDREAPLWADAVVVDHRNGIFQAVDHLLGLGHRRIALLTGSEILYPSRSRLAGYREAFDGRGVAIDPVMIKTGSFSREFGFEQTSILLSGGDMPTAIIAGGIGMLPGVLTAIAVQRLTIPGDISVVAALDSDLTEFFSPPIGVERWDYAEVGRIAARLALARLQDGPLCPPRRLAIPAEFRQRKSTAPPRSEPVLRRYMPAAP